MNPGLVVKLRPDGPWRIGSDSGARNRVDAVYHSDALYSAVTSAMARFGSLEDWLDATARAAAPAVRFSSFFPVLDDIDYVVPPRTVWPPVGPVAGSRVRWKSARFVPATVVRAILTGGRVNENQWAVDGPSECLIPAGAAGPFRTSLRWSAAVDRLTGSTERHGTACIEFRSNAGLWTVVSFRNEAARDAWLARVKAAFRYLADTGFGGERSRGWGRAQAPEFIEGSLPGLVMPGSERWATEEVRPPESAAAEPVAPVEQPPAPAVEERPTQEPLTEAAVAPESPVEESSEETPAAEAAVLASEEPAPLVVAPEPLAAEPALTGDSASPYWLLSVFAPAPADAVDWERGNYALLTRGGRIESPAGWGEPKKQIRMVAEGSVLFAATPLCGAAADVSPDGFPHPVYRAGFPVAIPLPLEIRKHGERGRKRNGVAPPAEVA